MNFDMSPSNLQGHAARDAQRRRVDENAAAEGMTYELEVRLLSRHERHDGQLYSVVAVCSLMFDATS